jgi:excisionase family DNA binding protein
VPTKKKAEAGNRRWLRPREAAEYIGVTERWMKRAVDRKLVPYHKRNRLNVFDRYELDAWMEEQRVPVER